MSKKISANKELYRQCSICGAEIIVIFSPNGHYMGGHYFGKIELSANDKAEYWECDNCYNTDESLPQKLTKVKNTK